MQEENNASVGADFTISRVARRKREKERKKKGRERKKRATLSLYPHREGREEDPEMEATISMRIPFH